MTHQLDFTPLLSAKKDLEHALEVELSKVTAIRKRLDAISTAINVLRSSDEELQGIIAELPETSNSKKVYYDKDKIQSLVLEYAGQHEWFRNKDLLIWLQSEHQMYVPIGTLRKYMLELGMKTKGIRDQTKYSMAGDVHA